MQREKTFSFTGAEWSGCKSEDTRLKRSTASATGGVMGWEEDHPASRGCVKFTNDLESVFFYTLLKMFYTVFQK